MARTKDDGRGRLGGRAKGTPNRFTGELREWLEQLINNNREQIQADLTALEPKDRLIMLEKLMSYVVPKQQAVSAQIDFSKLTDEQLDKVVTGLIADVEFTG